MNSNTPKCNFIYFHHKKSSIIFSYNILTLSIVTYISDLGIIFEPNLTFNLHILKMINKLSRRLGFTRRYFNDFTNPFALESVFCSLVWSCLDYNFTLSTPYQSGLIKEIEAYQNRFLRLVFVNCKIHREPHSSYALLLNFLHSDILEVRKKK